VKARPSINIAWLDKKSPDEARAFLSGLSEQEAEDLAHTWEFFARPEQLAPPGDWQTWLFLAGRGSGKTSSVC
jgi:phage terminase large subunit-like protein